MLFESTRITLRKMIKEDTALYHKWRNDPKVMHSTSSFLDVYSIEATSEFVEQVILGSSSSKSYIMMEKNNDTPIGIVSLVNIDTKNRHAECIIDIGEKEYWGRGYGAEGMKLLLDYAFNEMNLHRLYLNVYSFNEKAIHLYKKLGFHIEGSSRESLFRDGKWHDIVQMGLLQREYVELSSN